MNLGSDEDRRSSSRFLPDEQPDERSGTHRPCILLIEDNSADAFLVEAALKENDVQAELRVVRDGEEAFELVDAIDQGLSSCPDLVVLDLNLPKKSGHEVLRKMRESAACRDVPVVILSSSALMAETDESKRLGVARHIQKPVNLAEFMRIGAVLKAILSGRTT